MLDSIRGSLLGRPNFPHQHFIARGAHSITLFSHGGKNSASNVKDLIWLLEKLVRIHDQLDEQLHAGFYFYILTSTTKFVSNTIFIWPFTLLVFGVSLPAWLGYISYNENNSNDWVNRKFALIFLLINYIFCGFIYLLPGWLLGDSSKATCLAQTTELQELRK